TVFWGSLRCCSFLPLEVSQTCSQLIHTCVVVVVASWLETRNQLQKRQEKNEFKFQLRPKNFLDGKNATRVSTLKRRHVSKRFHATQTAPIWNYSDQQTSLVIV